MLIVSKLKRKQPDVWNQLKFPSLPQKYVNFLLELILSLRDILDGRHIEKSNIHFHFHSSNKRILKLFTE